MLFVSSTVAGEGGESEEIWKERGERGRRRGAGGEEEAGE